MPDEFHAAVAVLAKAVGPHLAVTLDELTVRAGLPNRRAAEQLIERRLADFPFTLVAGAGGYYIPTSADDVNRYAHSLHSRHRRMQLREATVRRKARAAGFVELPDGRFANPPAQQTELRLAFA